MTATPFNTIIALLFVTVGYGMFGFRHTGLAWIQVGGVMEAWPGSR